MPCTNCATPLRWEGRSWRAISWGNAFALIGSALALPVFWPALRDGTDLDHPSKWPMLVCLTVSAALLMWGVGWGLRVEVVSER